VKKIIPIILFCCFFSCRDNNSDLVTIDSKSPIKNLIGQEIKWTGLSCPFQISILDSILLIIDQCNDFYFHGYNIEAEKEIFHFGSKGKGPGEYTSLPIITGQWIISEGKRSFIIRNISESKLDEIDLDSLIQNGKYLIKREYDIPLLKMPAQSTIVINDGFLICNSISEEGKIIRSNNITGETEVIWPHDYSNGFSDTGTANNTLDLEMLYFHPDRKYIVGIQSFKRRINIYDANMRKVCFLHDPVDYKLPVLVNGEINFKETINYYGWACLTQDFIYVLNDGIYKNDENLTEILVLDYSGSLKMKLVLNARINVFAVDEVNKTLFGISSDSIPFFRFQF
jgi:hypothetical protein